MTVLILIDAGGGCDGDHDYDDDNSVDNCYGESC